MTWYWCLFACLCLARYQVRAERVLGKETDDFDFDGLPGATYEFKVEIKGGREECYYQNVPSKGNLWVSYEVLRGGDGEIALFLYDKEANAIIKIEDKKVRGGFEFKNEQETRVLGVCLDNSDNVMGSTKLIYLMVICWIDEEWSRYDKEITDLSLTVGNFTTIVDQVVDSVKAVRMQQKAMTMYVIRDWYLISDKDTLIKRWSIAGCVIIVATSCFQVYFVRRLFRTVNVIPKRPRA